MSADNEILTSVIKRVNAIASRLKERETFESPPIVARYGSTGGENASDGIGLRVNFNTVYYDPYGLVTTGAGAWAFTAPVTGTYHVTAGLMWASGTYWQTGEATSMHVNANGSNQGYLDYRNDMNPANTSVFIRLNGSILVRCPEGADIYISAVQNTGGTVATYSGGGNTLYTHVSIHLVK